MSCRADLPLAYVEGRLAAAARTAFDAHLGACAACSAAVARLRGAKAALADCARAGAPELDYGRVQAGILAQLDEPAPRRRRWLAPALAGACTIAALVVGARLMRAPAPGPARPPGPAVVAAAPTPLQAVPILVQGDVKAVPAGDALSLRASLAAGAGARVGAGRLALQMGEGTAVVAARESELALRALDTRDVIIYLGRGKLYAQVAHRAPGQRFMVVTPGHSVAVRGTRYAVERLAAATRVEVLEGEVEVHTVGTGWDAVGARVPAGTVIEFPDAESPARIVGTGLTAEQRASFTAAARAPLLPGFDGAAAALAASGVIELGASPPAAATTLDREPLGPSPVAVRAPYGRHVVELSRPGAGREVRTITVGAEPQRVLVRLVNPEEENARSAEVARTLRGHLKELRHCYERGLRAHPGIAGVAELRLTVGESGRVQRATVAPGSGLPASVEACLVAAVKRLSCSKGSQVTVAYPLVLRPELSFETP
ncbi:MAG TPA: AgmX/PglI C-terminal domain-containing protein [Polyangia bacterium]|jgi:hypothetical protein